MTSEQLKSIIEAAGVRMAEAAVIFRVAPSTVYRWMESDSKPKQPVVYEVACKFAGFIQDATAKGYLPVKDAKGKARLAAIRTAIRTAAAERVQG